MVIMEGRLRPRLPRPRRVRLGRDDDPAGDAGQDLVRPPGPVSGRRIPVRLT